MESVDQQGALRALVEARGASYAALSRRLGRNAAYLQQFVTRGSPRRLDEADRQYLARYFGVAEALLGGPEAPAVVEVARLDVGASAGPGAVVEREARRRAALLPADLLRQLGVRREAASMIRVEGESMVPTLRDGDEILVDGDRREVARDAIHVVRVDGTLLVKRLRRAVGGVELVSDNPDYPPLLFRAGECDVIGRVAWLSRAV